MTEHAERDLLLLLWLNVRGLQREKDRDGRVVGAPANLNRMTGKNIQSITNNLSKGSIEYFIYLFKRIITVIIEVAGPDCSDEFLSNFLSNTSNSNNNKK